MFIAANGARATAALRVKRPAFECILTAWYASLARKFHADREKGVGEIV
jgi:hypothetical protein